MKSKDNYHYTLPEEVQAPIIKLQKVPITTKWEDFTDSVTKVAAILILLVLTPPRLTLEVLLGLVQTVYCQAFAIFDKVLKLCRVQKGPFPEINSTINYIYHQQHTEEVKKEVKLTTDRKYTIVLELKDVLVKVNSQNSRSGSKKDLQGTKLKDLQILKRKYLTEFLKNVIFLEPTIR